MTMSTANLLAVQTTHDLGEVVLECVGEIDLSSAALSGVCATVAANLAVNHGWALALAIAAAVGVGLAVVLVEAAIIIFGVPSLIVTLGGMVILQGLLLVVLPPEFTVSVGGTDYARIASAHVPTSLSFVLGLISWALYCWSRLRQQKARRGSMAGALASPAVLAPAVLSGLVIFTVLAVLTHGDGLSLPVVILTAMLLVASSNSIFSLRTASRVVPPSRPIFSMSAIIF